MHSPSLKLQALRAQLGTICTALAGAGMFGRARELAAEFPLLEFRLDTLDDPANAIHQLAEFLRDYPAVVAIATCRRKQNGGHFAGSAADELSLLQSAVRAGARLVDLSLETAEELTNGDPHALNGLRTGPAALLVSWHDFNTTPDLQSVYRRIEAVGPDLYKIVPTARTLRDSFALLQLLQKNAHRGNLVAMSMGVPGIATRILGPRFGSVFTFGSSEAGNETAPGQVTSLALRDLYRIERISAATKVYGVFGKPIGGSKSPVMLNTAFRERQLDAVYLPFETDSKEELFAAAERLSLAGASVTMPLKEQIVPMLAHMSDLARELGAANTLTSEPSGWMGDNTDAIGILRPLESRISLQGARILVLGAGGAARAAVFALRARGAVVSLCNRTHEKAETLAKVTGATAIQRGELAAMHFDVVLNATPFGMVHQQMDSPISHDEMNCNIFFDMVYNPVETPLVRMARARGIAVIPGIEMFVTQGAAQFQRWTGEEAPMEAMREAVLDSLQKSK